MKKIPKTLHRGCWICNLKILPVFYRYWFPKCIFLYTLNIVPVTEKAGSKVKKKMKVLTPVLFVLIAAFILLTVRTLAGRRGDAAGPARGGAQTGQVLPQSNRSLTAVRVTPVVSGTIETSVVINGDVLAANQVSIYPAMPGKLVQANFSVGDTVNRGDVMAMVDPARPGEVYSLNPVISTVSGTVLKVPFSLGDTVNTGSVIYVLGDLSVLLVETFVPERFATAVHRGLAAEVSFEALPGERFGAAVEEVSPVLDPGSRTLRIRLRFTGRRDGRIKAGMFATVSLVTDARAGVPVIPRFAVINTYGSWIVFVVNEEGIAERRVIRPGIENEEYVEILEGLEEGESVVTAGQNFLSDQDPVRVIQ
jgi:multidrug efflux pump subunit AcrA (membrane-fusion protein)